MSGVKLSAIALFIISVVIFCLTFEVWAAAFLGVLFALSLNGPAEWIRSKWRMPSWTATLFTMLMVLIVKQVVIGLLGGAWGILIATPLLVMVMVRMQQLYVREYIERPIKVIGTTDDEAPHDTVHAQQREQSSLTPVTPVTPVTP